LYCGWNRYDVSAAGFSQKAARGRGHPWPSDRPFGKDQRVQPKNAKISDYGRGGPNFKYGFRGRS